VWRYSPIDDLDLDRYEPGTTSVEVDAPPGAKGLRVGRASELGIDLVRSVAGEPTTAIGMLHDAVLTDPVVIDVAPGAVVEAPVTISVAGPAAGVAAGPHVVVRVGEDAEVRVVERHEGGAAGLLLPLTELDVARAGRVRYLAVQRLDRAAWSIGSLVVRADTDATAAVGLAAFGGGYARLRTDCHLTGRGAHGDLFAVYFGDGDQTLDFRTFQAHEAPDTTSDLVFSGALAGHARSVYTGLIRVEKEARGTNAFQTNRNLKLSEHAWAESVPNLVIENNDVRCSHASTVGPIDPEHRFYLESRGVPTEVAERLIVAGFFADVLARFPLPDVAADLRADIDTKLAGVSS
jgi:Fe-S cluster assembly protein SufD